MWDVGLVWPSPAQRTLVAWIQQRCALERGRPSRHPQWSLGFTLWALEQMGIVDLLANQPETAAALLAG
eukprot:10397940-Prorocentrum_lima.AAC.1